MQTWLLNPVELIWILRSRFPYWTVGAKVLKKKKTWVSLTWWMYPRSIAKLSSRAPTGRIPESDTDQSQFLWVLNQWERIFAPTSIFEEDFLKVIRGLSEKKVLMPTNDSACKSSSLDKSEPSFDEKQFLHANSTGFLFLSSLNSFWTFSCGKKEASVAELDEAILNQDITLQITRLEDEFFGAKTGRRIYKFLMKKHPEFVQRITCNWPCIPIPIHWSSELMTIHQDPLCGPWYDFGPKLWISGTLVKSKKILKML